ncbi:MAG: metalloregulator ArsR/SmtB family transcription factor [Terriglobales bacterium]
MVTRSSTVFRAIADPTRREILNLLRGRELTVGEIAAHFRCTRPAVSRHLRRLRAAGLVRCRRQGAARVCRLDPDPLRVVEDWLHDYRIFWRARLRELQRFAERTP